MDNDIKKLLKQRKEIASDFNKLKNPDSDKAMLYTLMISEMDDRIGFYTDQAKEKRRSIAFERQTRIKRNTDFLVLLVFIVILQLIMIAALITLRNF